MGYKLIERVIRNNKFRVSTYEREDGSKFTVAVRPGSDGYNTIYCEESEKKMAESIYNYGK